MEIKPKNMRFKHSFIQSNIIQQQHQEGSKKGSVFWDCVFIEEEIVNYSRKRHVMRGGTSVWLWLADHTAN